MSPIGDMPAKADIFESITPSALFTVIQKFHLTEMSYYGSAYLVGGTSSTADAVPLPLATLDLRSSAEGFMSAEFKITDT